MSRRSGCIAETASLQMSRSSHLISSLHGTVPSGTPDARIQVIIPAFHDLRTSACTKLVLVWSNCDFCSEPLSCSTFSVNMFMTFSVYLLQCPFMYLPPLCGSIVQTLTSNVLYMFTYFFLYIIVPSYGSKPVRRFIVSATMM